MEKKYSEKGFFQNLTRLFRRGRIVKKKIQGYDNTVAVADKTKSSGMLLLQKSASTTYSTITNSAYNIAERLSRYQDFAEMEYCLHADTLIAVPEGFKTIKALAEECSANPDKVFTVYAYDHNKKKIVAANAKQARFTRVAKAYTVHFSDGKSITGSGNHRLMMRDGTYCRIDELKKGYAMMPFYRKLDQFGKSQIYTMSSDTQKGWQPESEIEFIERAPDSSHSIDGMTFAVFLKACERYNFNLEKISKAIDKEKSIINVIVRQFGFDTYETFRHAYEKRNDYNQFTFSDLCHVFLPGMEKDNIKKIMHVSDNQIEEAAVAGGYSHFRSFKNLYRNSKVVKVDYHGEIPLYDLTVDGYKNFCTDSVVSHNTPEIAAGLDIYADETCLSGDSIIPLLNGKKLTVKELVDTDQQNFWVYSFDTVQNKIVPGLAKKVYKTGTKKLFKIRLNDGSFLRLTDNHRVLLSSNEYVRVDQLKQGDSLRSLYTKLSKKKHGDRLENYQQLFDPESTSWKYTHRIIAEHFSNSSGVVHHVNFDKNDNTPGNLKFMSQKDHKDYTRDISIIELKKRILRGETVEDARNSLHKDLKKSLSASNINKWTQKHAIDQFEIINKFAVWRQLQKCDVNLSRKFREARDYARVTKHQGYLALNLSGYKNWTDYLERTNHIIVSIEDDGCEDVYDLEVEQWHNFAVTADKLSDSYVFVHNCAQDEKGKVLHVYSDNEKIKETLEELFHSTLDVDYKMRSWTRNLVKHGDFFMYNDVHPEHGVMGVFPIPVNEIEREENYDPEDPLAVRFRWVTLGNRTLENWEISHFRLLGNDMFLPYGSSIIEPARRIWRQLVLIEDAMLVYRIVRAPERRVFYIDVGNIAPDNVKDYVEEQRKQLRASSVIDSSTGRVDLRSSTMSIEEDLIIPIRGGESGTKIEPLPGGQNTAAVEDVAYIQKKLFAAIKIPRAYLGYDESISSKATLAQEDIRFSRTIAVIQKTIISELNKIAIIHLFSKGFKDEDLQNFQLRLSNPSTLAQQQKLELWRSKFELASAAPEGFSSRKFIQREIWGMNDSQIDELNKERFIEKQIDSNIENSEGGGGSAGGGDDLFGGGGNEGGDEAPAGNDKEDLFAGDDPLDGDNELDMIEDGEINIKFDLSEIDKPVKPKSQIEKYKYDRSRIKHNGPQKLNQPDFNKMLSYDSYDPFDSNSLNSVVKNPLGESFGKKRENVRYITNIDSYMRRMLAKMTEKFHVNSKNSDIILEDIEYTIEDEVTGL